MTERDRLVSAFLDGTLDESEAKALLDLVRAEPETLRELAGLQDVDVLLSTLGRTDADRRRTADLVMSAIVDTGRRERLADAVVRDIGRAPRRTRRFQAAGDGPVASVFWAAGIAAAAVVAALLAFATVRDPAPARPTAVRTERHLAEERLRDLEHERERLLGAAAPEKSRPDAASDEILKKALAELEERRRRVEEDLRAAIRKESPLPVPPVPVPDPAPTPDRKTDESTQVAIAVLEQVEGEAFVAKGTVRKAVRAGDPVAAGDALESVGKRSFAVLVFPDRTRVELGADTRVAELSSEGGKRLVVARGVLRAEVTRQPKDRPMVLRSAQGEATVLGTSLRFVADDRSTTLEVLEGRVRLKRLADGRSAEVVTGHFAVVAPGAEVVARPIPPAMAVTSFTLINVDTNQPIPEFDPVKEGAVIVLANLPTRRLNLRANVTPRKVGSVRFSLDGVANYWTEQGSTAALYSLGGDADGKFKAWTLAPGAHTVTATPYPEASAQGIPGTPRTLTFRLVGP